MKQKINVKKMNKMNKMNNYCNICCLTTKEQSLSDSSVYTCNACTDQIIEEIKAEEIRALEKWYEDTFRVKWKKVNGLVNRG